MVGIIVISHFLSLLFPLVSSGNFTWRTCYSPKYLNDCEQSLFSISSIASSGMLLKSVFTVIVYIFSLTYFGNSCVNLSLNYTTDWKKSCPGCINLSPSKSWLSMFISAAFSTSFETI